MAPPTTPPGTPCLPTIRPGPGFGRWCPATPGFPPFRPAPAPLGSPLHGRPARAVGPRRKAHPSIGVGAPGSTAIRSTGIHLCALCALAYLHSRDDQAARQAVAYALGTVRRDLGAGASIGELAARAAYGEPLVDHLHTGYAPGPAG
jgi:hypothetical protein